MTYIAVNKILDHIPNKFEAIRVIALECRRINARLQNDPGETEDEEKITSVAVDRLIDGEVQYFDARERREEERSEAMLTAAEGLLDGELVPPAPAPVE